VADFGLEKLMALSQSFKTNKLAKDKLAQEKKIADEQLEASIDQSNLDRNSRELEGALDRALKEAEIFNQKTTIDNDYKIKKKQNAIAKKQLELTRKMWMFTREEEKKKLTAETGNIINKYQHERDLLETQIESKETIASNNIELQKWLDKALNMRNELNNATAKYNTDETLKNKTEINRINNAWNSEENKRNRTHALKEIYQKHFNAEDLQFEEFQHDMEVLSTKNSNEEEILKKTFKYKTLFMEAEYDKKLEIKQWELDNASTLDPEVMIAKFEANSEYKRIMIEASIKRGFTAPPPNDPDFFIKYKDISSSFLKGQQNTSSWIIDDSRTKFKNMPLEELPALTNEAIIASGDDSPGYTTSTDIEKISPWLDAIVREGLANADPRDVEQMIKLGLLHKNEIGSSIYGESLPSIETVYDRLRAYEEGVYASESYMGPAEIAKVETEMVDLRKKMRQITTDSPGYKRNVDTISSHPDIAAAVFLSSKLNSNGEFVPDEGVSDFLTNQGLIASTSMLHGTRGNSSGTFIYEIASSKNATTLYDQVLDEFQLLKETIHEAGSEEQLIKNKILLAQLSFIRSIEAQKSINQSDETYNNTYAGKYNADSYLTAMKMDNYTHEIRKQGALRLSDNLIATFLNTSKKNEDGFFEDEDMSGLIDRLTKLQDNSFIGEYIDINYIVKQISEKEGVE